MIKRFLCANQLNTRNAYASIPDAARAAKNKLTGKGLGVMKQHVSEAVLRVEWPTQAIFWKRPEPRAVIKLVQLKKVDQVWEVVNPEAFKQLFGDKLTPEQFVEQADP